MEPFAKAAKLTIDIRFGNDQSAELAADLRANQQGKVILICWRHTYIPALLGALGANPKSFCRMVNGPIPSSIGHLAYLDQEGRLIPGSSTRIKKHLVPGDSQ